jgi:hypothetical protein
MISQSFPSHTTGHAGTHPAVRQVMQLAKCESRDPKRVEISIGQRNRECRTVRQAPWTLRTPGRLRSQIFS